MEDDPNILDLALELFYSAGGYTWSEARAAARGLVSELGRYAICYDQAIGDLALAAGDWETVSATLPF